MHSDIFIRAGVFREEKREEQVLVKHSIIAFLKNIRKGGLAFCQLLSHGWLNRKIQLFLRKKCFLKLRFLFLFLFFMFHSLFLLLNEWYDMKRIRGGYQKWPGGGGYSHGMHLGWGIRNFIFGGLPHFLGYSYWRKVSLYALFFPIVASLEGETELNHGTRSDFVVHIQHCSGVNRSSNPGEHC